ncbi:signal peptidase II [Anaerosporobacter mobilis DSM 15930]|jgi:signal peptidase II|uniref:Lipoprotein signal peptidase n=1 Tax=Anaerosporobacter mobilis DSM 15930 TaxID=1120996 RepID=A0A1M7GR63_9FIRM|nr:signal peptidase II [Anaerosporobacter mobilis]SHM18691.1 signal peptidase II [Anaerosporobacter mobilis DSM 15930]
MKKKITGLFWLILLIAFDQITKILAKTKLEGTEGFDVIKGVFQFHYHENRGMAFGMLQDKIWLFVLFTIVILIGIVFVYIKLPETKKYQPIHWILIFLGAGALGNCIDRVFRNYVVDFLYFELIDFPIFNVADSYVTVSCFILVLLFLFYYKDEDLDFLSRKKKQAN